jgi:hypothetical protein
VYRGKSDCRHAHKGLPCTPDANAVISPAEGSYDYACTVRRRVRAAGFHVDVDLSSRKMQKKVRAWVAVRTGTDRRGMVHSPMV